MAMTMTEKILAKHAGRDSVAPGENVWVDVDVLMTHDVCGPGTFGIFHLQFGKDAKVWDRNKIVLIPDHYIFTKDALANRNVEVLRRFAAEQDLPYFYDVGTPRCDGATYKAMEFDGDGVYALNIEERMTLCNMVIEAGGKNGVIAPDQVTLDYVNARNAGQKPYTVVKTDPGAKFVYEKVFDVRKLQPVIARPHSPDNRAFVSEVKGTKLDRAYIGSGAGGERT